jgi:cation diffusion facilitator CzcD-associated flavoprotein CzcO
LNYVADKFDLRKHMQFNCKVDSAHWDEANQPVAPASEGRSRHELPLRGHRPRPAVGAHAAALSGHGSFKGQSFHTFDWPHEPVRLAGKRVGVIGTGATAIQVIADIADKVGI